MRLTILLCDRFPGLLPSYIRSYESMFVRLFRGAGISDIEVLATLDGELPDIDVAERDKTSTIYLITGCNLSAYDAVPWIERLIEWVRAAAHKGLNLVGICFGHQLIAYALGGSVERAAVGWGTGVRDITLCDGSGDHLRLMYNHHDQVTVLPPGARLLATSTFCPIEAFTVGNNIITFQGHPEYVPEYNVHLIMDCADDEPQDVKMSALRSIGNMQHDGPAVAARIVEWFNRRAES